MIRQIQADALRDVSQGGRPELALVGLALRANLVASLGRYAVPTLPDTTAAFFPYLCTFAQAEGRFALLHLPSPHALLTLYSARAAHSAVLALIHPREVCEPEHVSDESDPQKGCNEHHPRPGA